MSTALIIIFKNFDDGFNVSSSFEFIKFNNIGVFTIFLQ